MARKFFRRFMPSADRVLENRWLRRAFGPLLHRPNLWRLNRTSVSRAFAIGLFWFVMPMPLQTVPAAACAIRWRANLPLSIGLTWISNPLTLPPLMYAAYRLGRWVLRRPAPAGVTPTWDWLKSNLEDAWLPLGLGSLMIATACAACGYFAVRLLWTWNVGRRLRQRQRQALATTDRPAVSLPVMSQNSSWSHSPRYSVSSRRER